MEFKFKQEKRDFYVRRRFSEQLRTYYPLKIPIICEKDSNSKTLRDIDKTKYLVNFDFTVSQFSFMIRQKLEINKEEAIYLLANGKILIPDADLSDSYESYKENDGFLYITYASEIK